VTSNHFLYQIRIDSEIPLPLQKEIFSRSDVSIKYGEELYSPPEEVGACEYYFAVGPEKAVFYYQDVALFTIIKGCEVFVSPVTGVDCDLLVNTVLGTPMGILLLQRGFLVLHASAVEINGKITCFLGASGAGKSTTVCSLICSGHKLVADDVVAIKISSSALPEVLPGYPWMKVGKELISTLSIPPRNIEHLGSSELKMRYNVPAESFVEGSSGRLACIYFLEWAEDFSINQMNMKDSLINLAKHQYGFVPKIIYPTEEKQRFLRSAEFIRKIPCFALRHAKSLPKLNHLAGIIEEHIEGL